MLKKLMYRLIVGVLALILVLPSCLSAFAEPGGIIGNWGDIWYDLDFASGALVIKGNGPIPYVGPYGHDIYKIPWYPYVDLVKTVTVQDGVTAVPSMTFIFCSNLISVYLGADVAEVSAYSFEFCGKIERFEVSQDNQYYCSENGVLYSKDKTALIRVPPTATGAYHIPDTVTLIAGSALFQCRGLTEVTIPNSVTTILNSSFNGCSGLTALVIPDSVTSIDAHSFAYCENITDLYISKNLKVISPYAFNGLTSLKHVTLPRNLERIKSHGFGNCTSLESVIMFNKIRDFSLAFSGCDNLTDIYYIGAYEDTFGMNVKPEYVFSGYNRHYGISGTLQSGVEWVLESNEKTLTITGSGDLNGLESVIATYGEFYNCVYASSELSNVEAYIGNNYANSGTTTINGVTYRVYAGSYTIRYDANGGTGAPEPQSKIHGQSIALAGNKPTKDGFVFLGWSQDKHAYTPTYHSGDAFDANRNTLLYAVWGTLELTDISLVSPPNKTTYAVGESLDLTGLVIRLTYNDGSSVNIAEGFSISGFSPDEPGEQKIKIKYQGKTVRFTVTVLPPQASITEIQPTTDKLVYTVGENLDIGSISLIVTFSDGNTRKVTDGFAVEGFDSSAEGMLCLTITYEGICATLQISVISDEPTAPTTPTRPTEPARPSEPSASAEPTSPVEPTAPSITDPGIDHDAPNNSQHSQSSLPLSMRGIIILFSSILLVVTVVIVCLIMKRRT